MQSVNGRRARAGPPEQEHGMQIQSTRLVQLTRPSLPGVSGRVIADPDSVALIEGSVVRAAGGTSGVATRALQRFGADQLGVTQASAGQSGEVVIAAGAVAADRAKFAGLTLRIGEHALRSYVPDSYASIAPSIDLLQVVVSGAAFSTQLQNDGLTVQSAVSGVELGADVLVALGHAVPGLQPYMAHAKTVSLVLKAYDQYRRVDFGLS
jgi:hypothetical protein